MCKDIRMEKNRLREGVKIDAPFPQNMELAYEILKKEGEYKQTDYIHIGNQYENQITTVRYVKTTPEEGKERRHFMIIVPDRYIPLPELHEDLPEEAVRSVNDI